MTTRWHFEWRLRTAARLEVGTGTQSVSRPDKDSFVPPDVLINDVQHDCDGRACIPGSSVRGALRAWVARNAPDRVDHLFGSADVAAGRLSFQWARVAPPEGQQPNREHEVQWSAEHATAVDAFVALDPSSRTAAEHLLRYQRYVPAGVDFRFVVTARDVGDDDVTLILAAMQAASSEHSDRPTFGAGGADGFGAFSAIAGQLPIVRRCEPEGVTAWLAGDAQTMGEAAGRLIQGDELQALLTRARDVRDRTRSRRIELSVALSFTERLMVKSLKRAKDSNVLVAKRDARGRVYLPASSFRGALRAQASRIARTMSQQAPHDSSALICDWHATRGHGCGTRSARGEQVAVESLCIVCALFGAAGWRSPLECSDHVQDSPAARIEQVHVASDRFTGGAAKSYLYGTDADFAPMLSGTIRIDLERLERTGKSAEALGLLALAVRDLVEGDIAFGLGRSKGFGWCIARVTKGVAISGSDEDQRVAAALAAIGTGATEALKALSGPLHAARQHATAPTVVAAIPAVAIPAADGLPSPIVPADRVLNPYHFIPVKEPRLDTRIAIDGQGALSDGSQAQTSGMTHALYRSGHFSGTIKCTLTTETEVVVGRKREDSPAQGGAARVEPFEVNGQPAIPGSSLRGVFTSLGEAASNSALRVLERRAISRRAEMRESLPSVGILVRRNGKLFVKPLCPGPLRPNEDHDFLPSERDIDQVFFTPSLRIYLSAADVEIARTRGLLTESAHVGIRMPEAPFEWEELQGVRPTNGLAGANLKFSDDQSQLLGRLAPVGTRLERWSVVEGMIRADPNEASHWVRGHLLVLGGSGRQMPSLHNRHYELFVPEPELEEDYTPSLIPIRPSAIECFHLLADEIYNEKESGTQQRPYEPFRQLRPQAGPYRLQENDLVFFEHGWEGGTTSVVRLALSSIWRKDIYPGATTRSMFRDISGELLPFNRGRKSISIGEALFGWVRLDEPDLSQEPVFPEEALRAFASRVQFGTAVSVTVPGQPPIRFTPERTLALLASPKPPTPATYLRPTAAGQAHEKRTLNRNVVKPQGRKYYLHGGPTSAPWLAQPPAAGAHMHVRARAIPTNARLDFEVKFDNLTAFELGLLLYTLRPTAPFRHKVGMGKPLGLGTARVDIVSVAVVDRVARYASAPLDSTRSSTLEVSAVDALRGVFDASMDGDIKRAIRLLGESTSLSRVMYPYRQPTVAREHFKWFVWNNNGPRHHLTPLTATTTALPTLPVAPQ